MPSSLNYNFFLYTHIYIYIYIRTDPITLPCSLARAGNKETPSRCLVELFKKYISHRPDGVCTLYLTPLRKEDSVLRCSKIPVGHNKLSAMVGRLCKEAAIPGFKTNHSL